MFRAPLERSRAHQLVGSDQARDTPEPSTQSAALPGLDLGLLVSFLDHPTAMQAVRAFRAALGA